jgi:hypothetical protein
MSINKKLVSAALTATTILWAVGAAALPLANAQTSTSTAALQAQIASLMAEINQITAQLNANGVSTSGTTATATTGTSYNFTSDLTIGSKGAQVTALQQFLIAQGDLTGVSAPTAYFGTLTQSALAKFQKANGISPSTGYFGPISRAYIAKMNTGTTTTTTTTTTTGTGTGTTTTGTTVVAPATGLQVGLASDNPAAGSLIVSGSVNGVSQGGAAARIPVLSFTLTAGNSGAATVSQLVFQKNGVISDSAVANAYLVQNGQVVAQYASLGNGVLTFSGLNLSIPAGQTQEFQLAVGLSSGSAQAGNTVSFSLPVASDVTAWSSSNVAVSATGSFPLSGNLFTVTTVSDPGLSDVQIEGGSIGTSVTAGTQGNIVGAWTFHVDTNPVYLQNLNFHVIGSANLSNIQNVKLLVNGTQVGQTLSAVSSNGMADFAASTSSIKLNTGTNNVQVVADIMGSPNMNFEFEILNGYDVLAVDSQYNVPITVSGYVGGAGTGIGGSTGGTRQVKIQAGQINLNQDSSSPTNNVAVGQSNVTLAKYDLYAAGEPVKVQWLDFNIALSGTNLGGEAISSQLKNVSIVDDAGNQVGTTINQPPSSLTCSPSTAVTNSNVTSGSVNSGATSAVYADCFGSSGSPINYIVPANTTRVLSLKADIPSTAVFSTIQANLTGDTGNLMGQISNNTSDTNGVNGNTLTVVASTLGVTLNSALGNQSVAAGSSNIKIGSFALSASSADGVNLNTLAIMLEPGTTTNAFQNLKLYVGNTQFGSTQGVVNAETQYSFSSGAAVTIPAGQSVNVDVYADTLSNATGTYAPAVALTSYTGVGATSFSSVTYSNSVGISGQQIVFNGLPALQVSLDNNSPAANQIAQGTTGNVLGVFDILETSNVTPVTVTQLNFVQNVSSTNIKPGYSNLTLYVNGSSVATVQSPQTTDSTNNQYDWQFQNISLAIPAGSQAILTLKGDAGTKNAGSITDNTTSTFAIANVVAHATGGSSIPATITGINPLTPSAPMKLVQTYVTATGAALGSTNGRVKGNPDQLGTVTFSANASGPATLNSVTITLGGSAMPILSSSTIWLVDNQQNTILPTSVTSNTATFVFGNGTGFTGYKIAAGSNATFTLDLNTASVIGTDNTSQSLYANIQSPSDVQYTDAQSGLTYATVGLPTNATPAVQINSVSYAQGN